MREIDSEKIISAVEALFIDANINLSQGILDAIGDAVEREESPQGKEVLRELLHNAEIAGAEKLPVCQDTGLAVTFVELGQDVHITGGSLSDAVTEGARRAYRKGYLRKSCCHPLTRKNTGDNTPPIIHMKIVPGDAIKITAMPKGGGSENYGEVRMLTPAEGKEGIRRFALEMVEKGGPNPCPPIIVGVGIGGNLETAAGLSKQALMRPLGIRHEESDIAALEMEILHDINRTGIGPQGYGGTVTALEVHVEIMPCHIASLPVAVNIQCHAHRLKEIVL
ncbi:MAG TPA: fumarate hydratase [Syntrophorhabdaceae bacterium]|nr:fumarate hydratase [Syntrophorhabdaceae bacterium]